ncbi:hypothetical protein [Flammeovirga aprica]|uniref:GOLD domain-containing protein n=1 Tax=Flammeovirga aprica JL-4 TaxID=694437 RepID=A0A7X9S0K1_9BACT|nr:hypothetical protein [Flammeovirga aprica]NME72140.1 hypothetical protein [Flammeovirga aprica JL-4]
MLKVLQLFIFTIFLISCTSNDENTLDDECTSTEMSSIDVVTIPSNGKVNEPIEMTLEYSLRNGCGKFSTLDQEVVDKTVTLSLEVIYKGCICTQDATKNSLEYTFTPTEAGEYTFVFSSADEDNETYKILVSE